MCDYNEIDGCRGRYLTANPPLPYTLGMEVTGVADAAGPGAEAWLGRWVVATAQGAFGGHAEAVLAPVDMVFDAAVHARLVELLDAGSIRPVVGREVDFVDLPAALDAMEDRATAGRAVVHLST